MGGKTSTQEQSTVQQVDPTLRKEYKNALDSFKILASQEPQINEGVTIAGFTPQQEAAQDMSNAAASAFGFEPAAKNTAQTSMSATGIKGYEPGKEAVSFVDALSPEYKSALDQFYAKVGTTFEDKEPEASVSSGKGKGGGK